MGLTVAIAVAGLIVLGTAVTSASLEDPKKFTGWLLLGAVVFLALFNARKKLPFIPLGSAAAWLDLHVYVGWLTIGLFVLHIGMRMPDGALEGAIAILFIVVALSGVLGIFISRNFARRLTSEGEEVIFERIPAFRALLRREAEDLVHRSVSESGSATLADYYTARLKPFFDGPRNFMGHLFGSRRARFALQTEIGSLTRYLDESGRHFQAELAELVHRKVDLDHHYALQATLKGWLFVHIPLTYSMLILVGIHAVLAYAFSGGFR